MDASMITQAFDQLAEPHRVLHPDGTLSDGYTPTMDDHALLEACRMMLLSRVVDERAFSLQRQGRLGTYSSVNGEEAAVVGSAWALDPARDRGVSPSRAAAA